MSGARPTSIEERRRLVAESLQVGNPANRAKDLPEQADPRHDCQIELRIDEIRPYEHNPRRANNAKFAEIKESIRTTGIRNPLTVTRRPGEKHFIVEAGGNTRLLAVQQLWEETRDPRFEKMTVLFRPWRSEGHVLVAHLIENEQRGEMTFWDKANGVLTLKVQLEEEKGRTLSLRQLEEELKAAGFPVNTATLAHYAYATARLRIVGDAIPVLSGLDVKTIQPRLNLMKRYAHMRAALDEAGLYAGVFEPVFRRHADRYRESGTFSASELCQACEEALAELLGEDLARFRMLLDALAQSPQAASLESVAEPAVAPPAVSSANSNERLMAAIRRFAELAVEHPMEARARSIIAFLSAKLGADVAAESPSAVAAEGPSAAVDAELLSWLLDSRDATSAAFWEVARLVRSGGR